VPPGALSMSCSLRTERALAQETGAAAYLVKPVTKEQLESALRGLGRRLGSVLVVEDDPEMGRLLARMVRSGARRRRVRSASDGAEALRLVREAPPDVVLLDLLMPGTDGYEFLSALRRDERLRDLPVVVVTAKGRGSDAIVADALTVTRPGGLAIGELTRLVRACVNAGGRWTSLEDERPATTLSA
jgi:CheY-like chemotaxis protein